MRIFFTGATGVLGRAAVPLLTDTHDVTALARTAEDVAWLRSIGAIPVEVDLFDPADVRSTVSGQEAVVHFATSIPTESEMPRREAWRMNDRLRDEATGLLVDAALAAGIDRFIQQSVTLVYADGGPTLLDEDAPIDPIWDVLDSAIAAEHHVARFTAAGGTGVVLRLARLYGPGSASAGYIAGLAARTIPIIGKGRNYVSHIHTDDAATAILAALDAPAGTYNVADDEPLTAADAMGAWLAATGAPRPRRVPAWVARRAVGPAAGLLTVSHRIANRRFVDATGWAPRHPDLASGLATIVDATRAATG